MATKWSCHNVLKFTSVLTQKYNSSKQSNILVNWLSYIVLVVYTAWAGATPGSNRWLYKYITTLFYPPCKQFESSYKSAQLYITTIDTFNQINYPLQAIQIWTEKDQYYN